MKLITYILALVFIGGAAAFSMMNISKHEEQLKDTKELAAKVRSKKMSVSDREKKLQAEEATRDETKEQNFSLKADKGIKEKDVRDNKKQSADFDDDLEELVSQKDEVQKALTEIEKALDGENIPLDEVEQYVTDLENKKKDLNKTNVALQQEMDVFSTAVTENNAVISDFKEAQIKRRKNLAANKVSSLITAVDNEWGFVVVKPHSDAVIKQESQLVVIRGSKHIGRLSINAIEDEGGRVLANIDYSSLASGMRIRPGDRVILSKPLTK